MSEPASFTLDGQPVPFEPGDTLMQAAHRAGHAVPHLCWHPQLGQSGACRVCTVQVDGRKAAACTTRAAAGQVVASRTAALDADRRALLQMLFVEGNHFCPSCEKSGACGLQTTAYEMGMTGPHWEEFYPQRPVDASHAEVWLDLNRCILCKLCVRASHEVDGKDVFAIAGHGIGAVHGRSTTGHQVHTLQQRHGHVVGVHHAVQRGRHDALAVEQHQRAVAAHATQVDGGRAVGAVVHVGADGRVGRRQAAPARELVAQRDLGIAAADAPGLVDDAALPGERRRHQELAAGRAQPVDHRQEPRRPAHRVEQVQRRHALEALGHERRVQGVAAEQVDARQRRCRRELRHVVVPPDAAPRVAQPVPAQQPARLSQRHEVQLDADRERRAAGQLGEAAADAAPELHRALDRVRGALGQHLPQLAAAAGGQRPGPELVGRRAGAVAVVGVQVDRQVLDLARQHRVVGPGLTQERQQLGRGVRDQRRGLARDEARQIAEQHRDALEDRVAAAARRVVAAEHALLDLGVIRCAVGAAAALKDLDERDRGELAPALAGAAAGRADERQQRRQIDPHRATVAPIRAAGSALRLA